MSLPLTERILGCWSKPDSTLNLDRYTWVSDSRNREVLVYVYSPDPFTLRQGTSDGFSCVILRPGLLLPPGFRDPWSLSPRVSPSPFTPLPSSPLPLFRPGRVPGGSGVTSSKTLEEHETLLRGGRFRDE